MYKDGDVDVHKHSRRGVILQHDLVNDTRPWPPEFNPVLASSTFEEVKDLFIGNDRFLHEVSNRTALIQIVDLHRPPGPV